MLIVDAVLEAADTRDFSGWPVADLPPYGLLAVSRRMSLFTPAATGWYPKKAPQDARPVPVSGGPFPGVPVRGRGAAGRAEACWLPVKDRLTRHGLRHGHRTLMEELGTPEVLMDQRMGHEDGSVSARYSHVTDSMRALLMEQLTEIWYESLDVRLALHPDSPVPVLDRLLHERAASAENPDQDHTQLTPKTLEEAFRAGLP
jgi:hypothetical protein